jgi:hypothetical protein
LLLGLVIGPAHGADSKAAQTCTRLADDAARLACYDAALGVVKSPATQKAGGDSTVNEPAFGDDGRLHPHAKADLPKNLTAEVQEAAPLPNGLYRLTLSNGQVWRTTEADSSLAFRAKDTVTISRLLLGGYEISLSGHTTSVKAIRIL